MATTLNKGDAFQPGEVWKTPKGGLYRVMGYEQKTGKPKQAVLRVGADGAGRKVLRDWDAVIGWVMQPELHQAQQIPVIISDLSKPDAQALASTLRSQGREVLSGADATEARILPSA